MNFFKREKDLLRKKSQLIHVEKTAERKVTIWHHLNHNQAGQEALTDAESSG